jgi:hypothetical protein
MKGLKRLPVMIYGSLLMLSVILMIVWRNRPIGLIITMVAACLWAALLILPVIREEKRRKRKYHIFIPLTKHQPALTASTQDALTGAEETDAVQTEDSAGVPETPTGAVEPDAVQAEAPPEVPEAAVAAGKPEPEHVAEVQDSPEPSVAEEPAASAIGSEKAPVAGMNTAGSNARYIGHIESKKFHNPECASLPLQKNRVYLVTREEAVSRGFIPCSYCNP